MVDAKKFWFNTHNFNSYRNGSAYAGFAAFEAQVQMIPQVLECLLITGQKADYQLKVIVKDLDAYQELLLNRITRIPGISGVHTSFVLRHVIHKTAMPL